MPLASAKPHRAGPSKRPLKKVAAKNQRKAKASQLPPEHDWRTTDKDELLKRRQRAKTERMRIAPLETAHPIFCNFSVTSESGRAYEVEIRGAEAGLAACSCPDFRQNGLGTCKHVEAVRIHQIRRHKTALKAAQDAGSPRVEIALAREQDTLRVERNLSRK